MEMMGSANVSIAIMDSTQAFESFESRIEANFEIMGSAWQFVQLSQAHSESHLTEFRG